MKGDYLSYEGEVLANMRLLIEVIFEYEHGDAKVKNNADSSLKTLR